MRCASGNAARRHVCRHASEHAEGGAATASESAYLFGAACQQCDAAVGLVLPFANTQTIALHLEAVSQAVSPSRQAVLLLDQAGWHTTPKLPQFPKVLLLSLPVGSPELNPAEQIWQQLRDRGLANRCYASYGIVDACCDGWNKFMQSPGAIRSLYTHSSMPVP